MAGRLGHGIRQARKANEANIVHPKSSQANSTKNMTGCAPVGTGHPPHQVRRAPDQGHQDQAAETGRRPGTPSALAPVSGPVWAPTGAVVVGSLIASAIDRPTTTLERRGHLLRDRPTASAPPAACGWRQLKTLTMSTMSRTSTMVPTTA